MGRSRSTKVVEDGLWQTKKLVQNLAIENKVNTTILSCFYEYK